MNILLSSNYKENLNEKPRAQNIFPNSHKLLSKATTKSKFIFKTENKNDNDIMKNLSNILNNKQKSDNFECCYLIGNDRKNHLNRYVTQTHSDKFISNKDKNNNIYEDINKALDLRSFSNDKTAKLMNNNIFIKNSNVANSKQVFENLVEKNKNLKNNFMLFYENLKIKKVSKQAHFGKDEKQSLNYHKRSPSKEYQGKIHESVKKPIQFFNHKDVEAKNIFLTKFNMKIKNHYNIQKNKPLSNNMSDDFKLISTIKVDEYDQNKNVPKSIEIENENSSNHSFKEDFSFLIEKDDLIQQNVINIRDIINDVKIVQNKLDSECNDINNLLKSANDTKKKILMHKTDYKFFQINKNINTNDVINSDDKKNLSPIKLFYPFLPLKSMNFVSKSNNFKRKTFYSLNKNSLKENSNIKDKKRVKICNFVKKRNKTHNKMNYNILDEIKNEDEINLRVNNFQSSGFYKREVLGEISDPELRLKNNLFNKRIYLEKGKYIQ